MNSRKMENNSVDLIANKIKESRKIVITSHLRPDGDSICTGLALRSMLENMGKEVKIINQDNTPSPFDTIHDADKIEIGQIPPNEFDVVILLECANVERSGQNNLDHTYKINIDHHHSNDYYADINWVVPESSAVAELVLLLGEQLKIPFTPEISNHLYCAIVSDTGSFQFSNTNTDTFEACSKLVKYGANPTKISDFLFNNNLPEKIKLLGKVLSTVKINDKGNIAVIAMFKDYLDSLNIKEIDTEDITSLARSIRGVEIVMFFKEINSHTFRVSLRSKDDACAACVAEHFGGGGHLNAAGFTTKGKYENLIKELPLTVEQLLKQDYKKKKHH